MTLEELIKTLEGAQEMATKGKWEWDECEEEDDGKPWFSMDTVWVLGPQDAEGFGPEDLEAIAIRHNTGPEVLRYLERARQTEREWDRRSSTLHECIAEQRTRADKSEAEVERLSHEIAMRNRMQDMEDPTS